MILRRSRVPELTPGHFYVIDSEGQLATIRMCFRTERVVTIEKTVSNGAMYAHPRDTIPMRRLDGERWLLPPFLAEDGPDDVPVDIQLDGWDW